MKTNRKKCNIIFEIVQQTQRDKRKTERERERESVRGIEIDARHQRETDTNNIGMDRRRGRHK